MKLHLPKGLRAALLAAFTVLAASWSHQGYAATLTELVSMEQLATEATIQSASLSTTWEIAGGVVYDFDGTGFLGGITNADLLTALKGDQYVTIAAWIDPTTDSVSGDGCSIFGYGGQGNGIKVIAHKNGTLKATTKNVADFTTSATGIDLNTWQLVAVTMHKNGGQLEVRYMLDEQFSATISAGGMNAANPDSFAIGSGNSENARESFQGSIGDLTVFTSTDWATYDDLKGLMSSSPTKIGAVELEWNGTGTTAPWDTTSNNWLVGGEASQFVSGPNTTITFGTGTVAKNVTIAETIDAGDVTVNGSYTFTMSNDATLVMNSLALGDGATLTLGGNGTVMAGSTTFGTGSVNIAGNIAMRSMALSSGTTSALHVQSGGVLTIGTDATVDGQRMVGTDGSGEQSGTQAFSKLFRGVVVDVQLGGKLVLDGNMNFNDSSVSGVGNQDSGVADMEITGNVQINTYGNGCNWNVGGNKLKVGGNLWLTNKQYLNVAGGSVEVVGALKLAHEDNGTGGNYRASLNTTKGSTVTLHDIQFYGGHNEVNIDGSTLTFTLEGGNLLSQVGNIPTEAADLNSVHFNNATLVAQDNGWELAPIESATVTTAGTATLNVAADQQIILTFTNVDGSFTKQGAGSASVSGNGALNNTVVVTQGSLTLAGTYAIDKNMSGMTVTYSGATNPNNGFRTSSGSITVYTVEGTAVLNKDDAEFTYGGAVVELKDGKYEAPSTTDNTTFYINEDAENISTAQKGPQMERIVLADGTTLNVDVDSTPAGISVASGTGTVNILADKTLTGTIQGVALSGAGTYALTGGTAELGAGTTLADGWTGIVRISDATKQDGNNAWIDTLANENSWVEFIHFKGYDRAWASSFVPEVSANIILTSDGANAAWELSAFASSTYTMVTTGDWKGDGTFLMAGGTDKQSQAVEYQGDISEWVGSIEVNSPGMRRVTFSNNATAVNAALVNSGTGKFELVVGNAATFSKEVNVTKLTVNVDKSATFQANTTVGQLAGSGSLVKEGADTTLTVSAATGTGTDAAMLDIAVNAGTLKATAANALGTGAITVAAGATLDLANGGALGTTQAVTNNGTVMLGSTLTAGSIDGGIITLSPEFPVSGDLEDVGGSTTTGNGFSQGGVMHVYDTEHAMLTGEYKVMKGGVDYTSQMDEHGDITTGGADWTTYLMKAANPSQPTIKEIMEYADTQSGGTGTLQHIVVSAAGLSLVDDSDAFKTSMLGGDKLDTLIFVMVDGASLGMDADLANSLMFGSESGDAAAEIVLEKDAAIDGAIWAYTAEGGVANLTVRGAHTLTLDEVDLTHGIMTVQDGAKVAADTIAPEGGDSVVVKDTAELVLAGGSISVKSVDGAKDATLTSGTGAEYDIGSTDYTIGDALLTLNFSAAHNFGHTVSGDVTLVNAGTASVNDTNAANTEYAGLHAQNGNIYLANKTAVTVGDLTVDDGRTVGSQLLNDVAITVNGKATFGSGATVGSALTMAAGSTLNFSTLDSSAALANHALTLNKSVKIGTDLWTTLSGLAAEESTNLFTGVSALTLNGAEYSKEVDLADIFTHEELKKNKYSLSYEDGNVIITKALENNRYWKGGDGTWNYTTATVWTDEESGGSDAAFVSGYNAHFTAATGGTVTLGEDITAASITVSGADYTFAPGGHTLTVTNSVEADGHKATFNLGLTGENLALTATNGGTIALNAANSVKSVNIGTGSSVTVAAMRSLAVADSFVNDGTLTAAGAAVTLSKGTAKGGNATVGTLNLASGQSYTFGNLTAATVNGSGANLTIGAANTLMVTGNSTVATLSLGNNAAVAGTGTVTATGVTMLGDATVSGKLTTGSLAGTGKLSLNNGTLTFTGTAAPAASLSTSGNSTIATSGTGVTLTFKGTVDNAAGGIVTFTGSFDVGNCTTTDGSAKYVEGGSSDNGFKQAQKIVSVIDEGAADGSGATLTYNGKSIGAMDTKGQVTFQGDTDYTKYYVNSGSENVSKALNNAKQDLGTFELANGTTLVVDKNIDMDMVNVATGKSATMQIESGYTVTTDGTTKALALTGAGTLAVDAGETATGVALDDTWAGTVSFTEAALTTLKGSWKTGSTVCLTGVTGSLGDDLIEATVVLNKGTDDWGFGQTATVGTPYTNLEGTLTGDGNLGVKGGSVSSTFNLNGNIDGWTGNFIVATDADTTLNLGGSGSKTVNGSVSGSNLTVNVQADTTFKGALNVDAIHVDNTKAATLKADSTARWVDAYNGTLKVNDGKTLTVTDTAGPEGLKLGAGASIVLPGTAYLGGEDYGYIGGTVANGTSGEQAVTIDNANITATGATLRADGGTGFTVDNKLVNATLSVENALTAAVALNNVQDSLDVAGDLEIDTGGSLKVANGTSKQTLNISSGTLTTSTGSVIDADLALAAGVTADMGAAVAMNGGALTLNKGITLTGGLYDAVDALTEAGSFVNLFTNVGALTLGTDSYTEPVKALQYFTNLGALSDKGDYFLKYEGGNVFISFTPTTASTLTWNGTEDQHNWEQGAGTAENWLKGDPAEPAHFMEGDNAWFTGEAAKKLVTIDEDVTARNITVTDARYILENGADSTIAAEQFAVNNAALGKKGAGTLVLDVDTAVSLTNGAFAVQEGDVEIGTGDSAGTIDMVGSSMLDIAPSSTLTVATINADADSYIELGGTLAVANGSVNNIVASVGSLLKIDAVGTTAAGTLSVGADTYLYGLENHGTLDLGTNDLTLMEKTVRGGNVTSGRLTLAETGSTFGDLKANIIQYGLASADDAALDAENPNLVVKTISANGIFPVITLDLSETMQGTGSLVPMQRLSEATTYTLLHATGQDLNASLFTLGGALETLVRNGLVHAGTGLVVDHRDVKLTIGGLDLTWYTGKDETEWGYTVMNGGNIAHGGDTLDGVQHVVVDADRTVDVTGVGNGPGLRVRNITGAADKTITFTGTAGDAVRLIATEDTSSGVNVAARHIVLGVGLPGTDPIDPIAYDADLHVGSVDLQDARMFVNLEGVFSVDQLNGDEDSAMSGAVVIEGRGGAYRGQYGAAGAAITVAEDAEATLYAGKGLKLYGEGTAKLMYTKSTEIDGVDADGMTLILNNPNASLIGTTLTMQDESGLTNGTLVFGMSAIESAQRIASAHTPRIIEGSLVLGDGTTVVVNQDALEDSGIAMAVNNGGVHRDLALAYIGNEETYTDSVILNGYLYGKYYENARIEAGRLLVDRRTDFYTAEAVEPTSENGRAGSGMLDDALLEINPQVSNPTGELAAVMTALEAGAVANPDRLAAAAAGASAAALGAAYGNDVHRQLRAIRNRTTTMGLSDCSVSENLPYVNAWVNAEGDHRKLSADGTLAGYTLSSWGGTVGCDVDLTNRLTMGVAFTVMHGKFTSHSADVCSGDLDRDYVSVFARYGRRAWTNTLVATFGYAKSKLDRTVSYGQGGYAARDDADGSAFGFLYELGYTKALNEDASTCLQPVFNVSYRHSSLGGYTEKGAGDASLNVGDADMDAVTFGLGARLQSIIGTSVYNRATLFEGRVLAKMDAGDRDCAVNSSFTGVAAKRSVKSAEVGAFGVEIGVGLTIPVGDGGSSFFVDASGEFRSGYAEGNATLGYRFSF